MRENFKLPNELLNQLYRLEYSKMTAVICRLFGLKHIEIAEDIASETFLKATEVWGINDIPENPTAWLYTVAKNKTKDYLKRLTLFETKIKMETIPNKIQYEPNIDFTQQIIADSQLAMIFSVCNPINSPEVQISLALQILCGFSVDEIADAFLSKKETIKKRLFRAKINLRKENFQISVLQNEAIRIRLDIVINTLYLLFSEGYFSKSNKQQIRKELCFEAIRLAHILTENPLTNTAKVNALLALMCFQSSRLEARISYSGESILFERQDKNLWCIELIDKGNYYLINACSGNEISKYHLEAAIAYWHTTTDTNKWNHILQLYNQLICMEYSPMTALNRTFALSKVHGNEPAIKDAEKLNLTEINYYHSLIGYLNEDIDVNKSINHYKKAIKLTKSKSEKNTLAKEIERLEKKLNDLK